MGDLSIQDLVVEYSSGGYAIRPINGLNLDVAAGSLVILLGPSGCGAASCGRRVERSSSVASTSPRSTAASSPSIGATRWASSSRPSTWYQPHRPRERDDSAARSRV